MKIQDENLEVEQVFLNLPCSLWWIDRNHLYLGCNIECCGLVRLNPQEFLGKTVIDVAREHDVLKPLVKQIYDIDERIMQSGVAEFQLEYVVPQGLGQAPMRQLSAKKPIFNARHEVVGMLGAGILERHYDEQMKTVLDQLTADQFIVPDHPTVRIGFKEVLQMMPCSLLWMDRDHRYLGSNNEAREVLGVDSHQEIIGKTILDIGINKNWPKFKAHNIYDLDESILYTGFPSYGIESILPQGHKKTLVLNDEEEKFNERLKAMLARRHNMLSVLNWGAKKPIFNQEHQVIGLMEAAIYAGVFGEKKMTTIGAYCESHSDNY